MDQTTYPKLALNLPSQSATSLDPQGRSPPRLTPRGSAIKLGKPASPRPQQQPSQRKPSPKDAEKPPPRADSLKPLPSSPSYGTLKPAHPSPSVGASSPAPASASPPLSESSPRSASPSDSNGSQTDSDNTITTATSTTMIQADPPVVPPLTRVHFYCYHFHRNFAVSNNKHNPLPCMTCLKSDDKDARRWRCTFCCLRVCPGCVKGLQKCKDRSLMEFMENLLNQLEDQGEKGDGEAEDAPAGNDE